MRMWEPAEGRAGSAEAARCARLFHNSQPSGLEWALRAQGEAGFAGEGFGPLTRVGTP